MTPKTPTLREAAQALIDGWDHGTSAECDAAEAALRTTLAVQPETRTDGAPQEIWLQLHGDAEPDGAPVDYTDGVSWCWHKVFDHDVRYVLAAPAQGDDAVPNPGQVAICALVSILHIAESETRGWSDWNYVAQRCRAALASQENERG